MSDKFQDTAIQIRAEQLEVLPISATQGGEWDLSWSDAPFALIIHDHANGRVCPDGCAVWGLAQDMIWAEAWEDFGLASEYEIIFESTAD